MPIPHLNYQQSRARRAVMAILTAVLTAAVLTSVAHAATTASPSRWSRQLTMSLGARQLGLSPHASAATLAKAAIERSRSRLVGHERLGGLELVFDTSGGNLPRGLHPLRFRQTLSGERVLWSQINAIVAGGRVQSISGTVVPVTRQRAGGSRRINAAKATEIARAAMPGQATTLSAQPVIYAGTPDTPQTPKDAYVSELTAPAAQGEASWCVVIDAATGKSPRPLEGHRRAADATTRAARTGRSGRRHPQLPHPGRRQRRQHPGPAAPSSQRRQHLHHRRPGGVGRLSKLSPTRDVRNAKRLVPGGGRH
jgi:Zn-dependent metalloprotease